MLSEARVSVCKLDLEETTHVKIRGVKKSKSNRFLKPLSWPKSLLGFLHKILWKIQTNFLANPI